MIFAHPKADRGRSRLLTVCYFESVSDDANQYVTVRPNTVPTACRCGCTSRHSSELRQAHDAPGAVTRPGRGCGAPITTGTTRPGTSRRAPRRLGRQEPPAPVWA